MFSALLHAGFLFWMYACTDDVPVAPASVNLRTSPAATEHVVLVVIDGPRYSETWGAHNQKYIPYMRALASQGTFFTNFTNDGPTYTLAGHSAITTGYYQHIENDGSELPLKPSMFQHYLQQKSLPPYKASLVTSKEKLNVLADCRDVDWRGRFRPAINCGKAGGGGRSDAETLQAAINTLQENRPGLMLVQFLGPDANGHSNNWPGYLEAIQETDSLVHVLWTYLQQDKHYKDKTALLVTNDHGRHADGHKDGFVSHGDKCRSCKHISLLALGPEFPAGTLIQEPYHQADIPVTIAQLLGFSVPQHDGSPITPLLKNRLP